MSAIIAAQGKAKNANRTAHSMVPAIEAIRMNSGRTVTNPIAKSPVATSAKRKQNNFVHVFMKSTPNDYSLFITALSRDSVKGFVNNIVDNRCIRVWEVKT